MTTVTPRRFGFGARLSRWDLKFSPYLYISPFFLLFLVVGLFPIAYTAIISFMDWDQVRGKGTWIGFDQYAYVLGQPKFWIALRNTFSIFLLSSVPQMVFAVFLAALLDQNLRAKTFWRMGVLLPYVVAPVAVALIFSNLFGDRYGLVNTALQGIGLEPIPWHTNAFASHIAIATMVNFRWTGYNTLILLAAMQAIPATITRPRRWTARAGSASSSPSRCRVCARRSSSSSSRPPSAVCRYSTSPGCMTSTGPGGRTASG